MAVGRYFPGMDRCMHVLAASQRLRNTSLDCVSPDSSKCPFAYTWRRRPSTFTTSNDQLQGHHVSDILDYDRRSPAINRTLLLLPQSTAPRERNRGWRREPERKKGTGKIEERWRNSSMFGRHIYRACVCRRSEEPIEPYIRTWPNIILEEKSCYSRQVAVPLFVFCCCA